VRVQPVTIRYHNRSGTGNEAAAFVREMTVLESLRRIVREPALAVELSFGPPLSPRNTTRRELAILAHRVVSARLDAGVDPGVAQAFNRPRAPMPASPRGLGTPGLPVPA